ncbi:MAG: hypothetical protein ATN31_08065 [Candidatus Epulonipiscioides saccharophilum]|nr:MAG: hypothetical protein ATN31_08065 [Epulopiscium sp. AS2M-Bin001]
MKTMAVHSGIFHADDVFSTALMQGIYEDLTVIRTRDPQKYNACDIVADVGGGKYDHHNVNKKLRADGIPYCAFGLLWQDFGVAYIEKNFAKCKLTTEQITQIKDTVALDFITLIDASDNGIDIIKSDYNIFTASRMVDVFIPFDATKETVDKGFFEAVELAKKILKYVVEKEVRYFDDFNYIKEHLKEQNPAKTHYLIFDKKISFKKALIALDKAEDVLFVVYKDLSGRWMVQNVQRFEDSFEARKYLPEQWAGKSDAELDEVTGIKGCVFCHPARFLCGNETKEGAIAMVKLAVE